MPSRRRFLTTLGTAGTAGLAGCSALSEPASSPGTDAETGEPTSSRGTDTVTTESVFSPGTDAETEWPMPGYDRAFSAYNPDAAAPRDGVAERWSTAVPALPGRPVVAAGTVLVPTASGVVALDVDTGEERWRHGDEDSRASAPVVHDDTAYVGLADPRGLVALDVETGDQQWHAETTGYLEGTPTFGDRYERLYVGDDTGQIYQVDPASGEVTARTDVFGSVTALAYYPPLLLVGAGGGEVYNFSVGDNGFNGRWRRRVAGSVTAVAVHDTAIYVATWGGPVYRLQDGRRAGASRWEADRGATHGLAAAGYRGAVGCDLSGLRTFEALTGDVGGTREGEFTAAPAVAGDTAYVGGRTNGEDEHGFVAAYALSSGPRGKSLQLGRKRWQFDVESDRPVGPGVAVADGAVFACTEGLEGDSGPRVYALDPA